MRLVEQKYIFDGYGHAEPWTARQMNTEHGRECSCCPYPQKIFRCSTYRMEHEHNYPKDCLEAFNTFQMSVL